MTQGHGARATLALGSMGVLAALLASCSGLLPAKVEPVVPLAGVEHRAGGAVRPAGEIRTAVEGDANHSVYSDALIEADFRVETHFVRLTLRNLTDRALEIDWERSQFVDAENIGAPVVSAGSLTVFAEKDAPKPPNVLRGTAIRVRLAKHIGDESRFGVTDPLYKFDRGSKGTALRTAREMLGDPVRIVLILQQGGTEHEYAFTFRLTEVTVEGERITR